MDINDFSKLKTSAFSKYKVICPLINNITLGPNSITDESDDISYKTAPETFHKRKNSTIDIKKCVQPDNDYNIGNFSPFKQVLNEIEHSIQENVNNAVNIHKQKILQFNKDQENLKLQEWRRRQQQQIAEIQQQEALILNALNQHDKESDRELEKLTQHYKQLAENREQADRVLKAKQQQRKQLSEIIHQISEVQKEFRGVVMNVFQLLNECNDQLKSSLVNFVNDLKALIPQIEALLMKCKNADVSLDDAKSAKSILANAKILHDNIKEEIIKFKKCEEERLKKMEQQKLQEQKQKEEIQKQVEATVINEQRADQRVVLSNKSVLRIYAESQKLLDENSKTYRPLTEDPSMKKFIFDCKKAINTPINAISSYSAAHIMDKFNKLCLLLNGNNVRVGDNNVNASRHPLGVAFSKDLLARKFVLQGDLMVSSNFESAFCYASVIMALCDIFPDLIHLLKAHFFKQCPYLVPVYLPKLANHKDEDYYISLGYQYVDGVIEKQDKFLKRMTGISRLYFAMLVCKPRRGCRNKMVLNLQDAWLWLANLLNEEPQMDITATVLYAFLEVAGSTMERVYCKQFRKIVSFIDNYYLDEMRKKDSGGPVVRLEVLLQDYRRDGRFNDPPGILPAGFW